MNFGETKKALKALIDRPDLKDDQAGQFVLRAIGALERNLRLGHMKILTHAVMDGETNAIEFPPNYIEPIDLFTDVDTYDLVVLGTWQKLRAHAGRKAYVAMGQSLLLKPTPAKGTMVHLHYYGEAQKLVVDTDINVWLVSCFEAVLYTAAEMAADYFQIVEMIDRYGAKAASEVAKLEDQDSSEEWAGDMSIELPHPNIC